MAMTLPVEVFAEEAPAGSFEAKAQETFWWAWVPEGEGPQFPPEDAEPHRNRFLVQI